MNVFEVVRGKGEERGEVHEHRKETWMQKR